MELWRSLLALAETNFCWSEWNERKAVSVKASAGWFGDLQAVCHLHQSGRLLRQRLQHFHHLLKAKKLQVLAFLMVALPRLGSKSSTHTLEASNLAATVQNWPSMCKQPQQDGHPCWVPTRGPTLQSRKVHSLDNVLPHDTINPAIENGAHALDGTVTGFDFVLNVTF